MASNGLNSSGPCLLSHGECMAARQGRPAAVTARTMGKRSDVVIAGSPSLRAHGFMLKIYGPVNDATAVSR